MSTGQHTFVAKLTVFVFAKEVVRKIQILIEEAYSYSIITKDPAYNTLPIINKEAIAFYDYANRMTAEGSTYIRAGRNCLLPKAISPTYDLLVCKILICLAESGACSIQSDNPDHENWNLAKRQLMAQFKYPDLSTILITKTLN